jgi:hypothetical protein
VTKTTRSEVHADPHAVLLVGEEIDVVVAGTDGAQLILGLLAQRTRRRKFPACVVAFENRVLDLLRVLAADAEVEGRPDIK